MGRRAEDDQSDRKLAVAVDYRREGVHHRVDVVCPGRGDDGHDRIHPTAAGHELEGVGESVRGRGGTEVKRIASAGREALDAAQEGDARLRHPKARCLGRVGRVGRQHVDATGVARITSRSPAGCGWSVTMRAASSSSPR
jgi:hypothetical protein